MNVNAEQSRAQHPWHRIGIAVITAVIVVAGARGAFLLSQNMMNSVALVGSWVMLVLVVGYIVARFRPSVGIPLLVGFGFGAVVVALFAGMGMMT